MRKNRECYSSPTNVTSQVVVQSTILNVSERTARVDISGNECFMKMAI